MHAARTDDNNFDESGPGRMYIIKCDSQNQHVKLMANMPVKLIAMQKSIK